MDVRQVEVTLALVVGAQHVLEFVIEDDVVPCPHVTGMHARRELVVDAGKRDDEVRVAFA